MGLFGPSYTPVERALIEQETASNMAMLGQSQQEARQAAEALVQQAIALAKESGMYGRGPMGEAMLAETEGFWATYLNEIRTLDGVRDDDIRKWWDLDEVERMMVGISDELAQTATWIAAKRQGLSDDEATLRCRQTLAYYGRPGQMTSRFRGLRLLPFELKDRVMAWLETNAGSITPDRLPWAGYETLNHWVRDMVARGEL